MKTSVAFLNDFYQVPREPRYEARSVSRDKHGVWTALDSCGNPVAFFGDEFAKACGLAKSLVKRKRAKRRRALTGLNTWERIVDEKIDPWWVRPGSLVRITTDK